MNLKNQRGQSLIELVIALAVGVLFLTGSIGIIIVSMRIDVQSTASQNASELASEILEQVSVFANADWHNVDGAATSTEYSLSQSLGFFILESGSELVDLDGDNRTYTRSFQIFDVYRDFNNDLVLTPGIFDPSTLRVVATVSWLENGQAAEIVTEKYITRTRNRAFTQTDWSGGPNETLPIQTTTRFSTSTNIGYATSGYISIEDLAVSGGGGSTSNIHPIYKYAWSDIYGWIDFKITDTVTVSSTKVTGYAQSDAIGFIALDCATTPSSTPDICSISDFGIANDGFGDLKGLAWNDQIGWIRFDCEDYPVGIGDQCGTVDYGVSIDSNGDFDGWAWNDVAGWISFNCDNTFIGDTCATSDYKVNTSWGTAPGTGVLTSSIFDTQRIGGAAFNWIMWSGIQPTDTNVKFQIASSNNQLGPWSYLGPDGADTSYYEPGGPDTVVAIKKAYHHNERYVRYRVTLESDPGKTISPTVEDVILNWSY